jgi:hypothetical protein
LRNDADHFRLGHYPYSSLPESPYIFQKAIRDLRRRREEHKPKTILNEMFKQLGNGIYGKLGQGIKGTTAYNTRTDTHEEIGESKITNPYLAAHVTGLIRALLGELIASAGTAWTVISATTDSIVTNCQFSEVNLTGPVASYMIRVAEELEGRANHERSPALCRPRLPQPGEVLQLRVRFQATPGNPGAEVPSCRSRVMTEAPFSARSTIHPPMSPRKTSGSSNISASTRSPGRRSTSSIRSGNCSRHSG